VIVQGVGASLSPAIGGWIAQKLGYPAAFLILGSFAVGSIMIWLSSLLKPACETKPDQGRAPLVSSLAT
jgi:MFS family permease